MQGKRIIVTGKVQGVFFRQSTKEQAEKLGLGGWVRNNTDGSVEIAAFGEAAAVSRLVEWSREGSPGAEVENLEIEPLVYEERADFQVAE